MFRLRSRSSSWSIRALTVLTRNVHNVMAGLLIQNAINVPKVIVFKDWPT